MVFLGRDLGCRSRRREAGPAAAGVELLSLDLKSGAPQPTQRYSPSRHSFQYAPVKAGSVPPLRETRYCSSVSASRHCLSGLFDFPGHVLASPGFKLRRVRAGTGLLIPGSVQVAGNGLGLLFGELGVDRLSFRRRIHRRAAVVAILQRKAVLEVLDLFQSAFAQRRLDLLRDLAGISSSAPSRGQTTPCLTLSSRSAWRSRYSSSCLS